MNASQLLSLALLMGPQGTTAAELDFRMGLLAEAELRVKQGQTASPDLVNELDILRGDPVFVQFVLENKGAGASEPTLWLDPRSSPVGVTLRRPDGTEVILGDYIAFHNTTRSRGSPKPIPPGSMRTCTTFLYLGGYERPEGDSPERSIYLFEDPGRYEISATCTVGNPYEAPAGGEPLPTLTAGPVVVNVGEPIPGWEALKARGILDYAGASEWPALEEEPEEAKALVTAADRPWLTAWYEQLTAAPVEADEDQRPAEAQSPAGSDT